MANRISIKRYLDYMDKYPVRQIPKAAEYLVNQMAYEARKLAIRTVENKFIIRNRYVLSRIQFEKALPGIHLHEIKSKMGALQEIEFMRDQETGFTIKPSKGRKLAIPTRAARISKVIEKKKRTIYRESKLGNIKKIKAYKGKNKKQRIINMLQDMARTRSKQAALIPFPNKPGIYVIKNIKKRHTKQTRYTFRLHKLYDLSKSQQKIRATPWMEPTLNKMLSKEDRIAEIAWSRFLSSL